VAAIVTESAFSMDGDVADVRALRRIADEHGAALIVDEAHTLGVAGPRGAGVCVDASVRPDVLIGGLGKAFGLAGGFVAGSTALARSIDNFARTFVFSTAMLPAIAHAVPTAVRLVAEADPERTSLHAHVTALRSVARRSGRPAGYAPSAIVPFFIGDPDRAMRISSAFRERGYLIPAMRPPTVPEGTARLRMTPTALHSPAQIDRLCALLEELIPSPGDREHDDHPNHP
jgi:8-amino-7-oxononanoate synthase